MYSRNRIYINSQEQQQLRNIKIVFGGLGLGSVIAECALRMGFETLHLIDGDTVYRRTTASIIYRIVDFGWTLYRSFSKNSTQ